MKRPRIKKVISVNSGGELKILSPDVSIPENNFKVKHERRELHPGYPELALRLRDKLLKYKKLQESYKELNRIKLETNIKALSKVDLMFEQAIRNSE